MKPCGKCKGEMKPIVIDEARGEFEGVKVTIRKLPAVACDKGHRRFLTMMFASEMMDMVFNTDVYGATPEAAKKGLFTKRFHCPKCGKELPAQAGSSRRVDLKATPKSAEPFPVEVEYPTYRCGCGEESAHNHAELGKQAFKAITAAFQAVDVHP